MSLIWTLLDLSSPQFPSYPGERSYRKATWSANTEDQGVITVEDPEMCSSPGNMRESTAHYASPPEWVSCRPGIANAVPMSENQSYEMEDAPEERAVAMGFVQHNDTIIFDPSWGPFEYMLRLGDGSSSPIDWWDSGNL